MADQCTALVTVSICDQDGELLERFHVEGIISPDPGTKKAEAMIGSEVRRTIEDRYETKEVGWVAKDGKTAYVPDYDDAGPRTGR